jgi:8-oxo-dGTP pyrophosphatase MutT (NUDIX family)
MNNIILGQISGSAAIINSNKIMLIKRAESKKHYPNYWGFPSGGLEEFDTSIEATVIREVKEEVGLEFTPTEKFSFYDLVEDGKRFFALVHLGEYAGEVVMQKEEVSNYGFFTYAEAKKLPLAFVYSKVIDDLYCAGKIK